MPLETTPADRTGHKLESDDSIVVIEVVAKSKYGDVYLCRDVLKSDPDLQAGGYYITAQQLEVMITAYETGMYLDSGMI